MSLEVIGAFISKGITTNLFGTVGVGILIVAAVALIRLFAFLNIGNLAKDLPVEEDSPLKGKNIIFLDSSVTKGFSSYNKSFVDMIAKRDGAICVKEAVSGTTLIDNGPKSYVARLKTIDPNTPCDVFVCQLSTNDATKKSPLGKLSENGEYDTSTVCGAIEYIVSYVKETWNCPVVFYTNPQYNSVAYQKLVELLKEIAGPLDIQVIDLWSNATVNQRKYRARRYIVWVHPTRKGYRLWTPIISSALADVLAGKKIRNEEGKVPTENALKVKNTLNAVKSWGLRLVAVALIAVFISVYILLTTTMGIGQPGNAEQYDPANIATVENSPLKGKTILFLGSSVTEGRASKKLSYVEYIEKIDGAIVIKEAVSGTTVANSDVGYAVAEDSYLPRLMKYDATTPVDAIVIQLSTNDATSGGDLGKLSDSFDLAAIDSSTYTGGMEAVIAYAKQTWDCDILIYSNPEFRHDTGLYEPEAYGEMVQQTKLIAEKWDVDFLNMWEDESCKAVTDEQWDLWMGDAVHPTRAGYLEWWTPMFQEYLYGYVAE